jgi:hypothetical protein
MARDRKPTATKGEVIEPAAASAEIEDLEGRKRRLEELWADHPVVLVFLRHFG